MMPILRFSLVCGLKFTVQERCSSYIKVRYYQQVCKIIYARLRLQFLF